MGLVWSVPLSFKGNDRESPKKGGGGKRIVGGGSKNVFGEGFYGMLPPPPLSFPPPRPLSETFSENSINFEEFIANLVVCNFSRGAALWALIC